MRALRGGHSSRIWYSTSACIPYHISAGAGGDSKPAPRQPAAERTCRNGWGKRRGQAGSHRSVRPAHQIGDCAQAPGARVYRLGKNRADVVIARRYHPLKRRLPGAVGWPTALHHRPPDPDPHRPRLALAPMLPLPHVPAPALLSRRYDASTRGLRPPGATMYSLLYYRLRSSLNRYSLFPCPPSKVFCTHSLCDRSGGCAPRAAISGAARGRASARLFGGCAPPFLCDCSGAARPVRRLSGATRPRAPRQEAPAGLLHLPARASPQAP